MSANGNSGWNRSTGNQPTKRNTKAPAQWKGIAAGLAVVVPVIALCLWLFSGGETPQEVASKEPARTIRTVKPKRTPQEKARDLLAAGGAPAAKTNDAPANASQFPYTDGRKVISSKTNNWDQVIDICIMPNGKRRKVIRNLRKPLFSNVTDSLIARALATGNEEAGPPLPIDENMEEAFMDSLKTPIEFNADDSDEIKERKMLVKEAREQILAGIAEGGTFYGILSEHVSQQKHNAELKEVVMETVTELRESGDTDTLNQYLEHANKLLGENGVAPLDANAGLEESEAAETENQNKEQ